MPDAPRRMPNGRSIGLFVVSIALLAVSFVVGPRQAPAQAPARSAGNVEGDVRRYCGACHAVPPPATFPRKQWRAEVEQGYRFGKAASLKIPEPPIESVVKWYEQRAPEKIELLKSPPVTASPIPFDAFAVSETGGANEVGISHVQLAHLSRKDRLDIIACDINNGGVFVLRPYDPAPRLEKVAQLLHPAHAEVVDLDGDGIQDILVADIGLFFPADARLGRIMWLRGHANGTYEPITLLTGVARVVDVRAHDFNGDNRLDLVVAEFGHHKFGSVMLLTNRTTDWAHPIFERRNIERVTGTIHCPIADINGDGKPDIICVQSQEHEQIVAYLNEGKGKFRRELIFGASHPDYGSSGIQLADINGDGRLDVLATNGDLYDEHTILRPDQGVQWLENTGKFPFVPHSLTKIHGAYHAVAADVDGDGRQDIFAVTDIAPQKLPKGATLADKDSVILLLQKTPGKFERYSLERGACDHFSCVAGDVFGDGKISLVTGVYNWLPKPDATALRIFRNLGKSSPKVATAPSTGRRTP